MAEAIIGGLIADGTVPEDIIVMDPNLGQRDRLHETLGIGVTHNVDAAIELAETIVLAVKPQIIPKVAESITEPLTGKLIISIAAGVTVVALEALFGQVAVARTMPNTPALVGLGATGLYVNTLVTGDQARAAQSFVESFGICVRVNDEPLLDAITAVSGSGPAYYFLMIEEMIKAGTALGLAEEDARALTLQTALGAATMAANGDVPPEELRLRVTSPNGTTHAAITSLQGNGFGQVISQAMTACRDRAVELGEE